MKLLLTLVQVFFFVVNFVQSNQKVVFMRKSSYQVLTKFRKVWTESLYFFGFRKEESEKHSIVVKGKLLQLMSLFWIFSQYFYFITMYEYQKPIWIAVLKLYNFQQVVSTFWKLGVFVQFPLLVGWAFCMESKPDASRASELFDDFPVRQKVKLLRN